MDTLVLIVVILSLIIYLLIRKKQMSTLKRCGIDGPKPNLLFGNIFQFFNGSNVQKYQSYIEKYGKTCGYYVGRKMNIITIDLELIKKFQIKDFDKFSDRQNFGIKHGVRPNPALSQHIISNTGARWKEVRSMLNPTFSALKLKTITPIMESAIDIFIGKIDDYSKKQVEFNIYEDFQLLTADVISKSTLGVDTNVQHDPNNKFFVAARQIFDTKPSKLRLMFVCFPELDHILYPLRRFLEIIDEVLGNSPTVTISKLSKAAIKLRKNSSKKVVDLLQIMLDSKMSEEELANTNTSNLSMEMTNEDKVVNGKNEKINGKIENGSTIRKGVKSLSEEEVISNAIIFYEAGYETTSTALGFISHFLVTRPDIQDKVRQEVVELFEKEGKFDYNTVNKLSYMQCVINESMRYYPPVTSFITRNCREEYRYEDIIIPKNSTIRIPTNSLHHCEEYWPNHNVFNPERFRDKKNYNPVAFQAFGNGPRNCIGMRFALYEMKLALAKLLFRYKLVPGPSTEKELTVEGKIITQTPKYGVFVKAIAIK